MSKIVAVTPTTDYFSVEWNLGRRCNYDCMYCPTDLHDATSKPHSLSVLQSAWQNIVAQTQHQGLKYKIVFSGGEVTANRSFLPLIEYLRSGDFNIGQLLVTTNGSASQAYYLRLAELVDSISFSTHTEFWNESKFFDTVIAVNQVMIRPEKSVHVNIMDEPEVRHRFVEFETVLAKHNVSHSINTIEYD